MRRPVLDARHRRILTFVVESHVSRAEPVGSQYVRAAYHLSISPATIRNAMQRLEELGYLDHPHTSAGRVPTELGYRLYVDRLMRPGPLHAAARRAVEDALRPGLPGEDLDSGASRVLAHASRQLALVAVRGGAERVIERADLIGVDGAVVLVVRESKGAIASSSWTPAVSAGGEVIRAAWRMLERALPLQSADRARTLAAGWRREGGPGAELAAEALERMARHLTAATEAEVRIDGADHIASQPEFQSPDRLKPLVSLLADRQPLARALEQGAGVGRAHVSIGSENGPGPMRHCSLVAMRVDVAGRERLLGVMGPLRMPYRNLVSLVSYVGERLAKISA